MPNISGRVYYDQTRLRTGTTGIANVPVCLYSEATGQGVVALTNTSGAFYFSGVPSGSYTLIECFGTSGSPSPVDYSAATAMEKPEPADPPISSIPSPIPGANKLDSVSPNTLFVTVASVAPPIQYFYDGPIEERPLALFAGIPIGPNLITNADNGTWGEWPDGTPVDTCVPTNIYPGMLTGLTYSTNYPLDNGEVVYANFSERSPGWWCIADHTTGLETGRMIVVNGANPGAVFFKETVTLKANTYYALTMWIVNMNDPSRLRPMGPPRIGMSVTSLDGTVIFRQDLNDLPRSTPPQWTQIGGLFYSTVDTDAEVSILSMSAVSNGNDYSIDDIVLNEIDIIDALLLEKSASQCPVAIGETITYSATITNTSDTVAKNTQFQDVLAANVTFVPGSVTVDDIPYYTYDPETGFPLGDMEPGGSVEITYQVIVDDGSVNPIPNKAEASYDIFVSQSGDVFRHAVYSNTVLTNVTKCNLRQAGAGVLESIALVQAALAHIMNAEGEKLQKAVALDVSEEELIRINGSVANMMQSITVLESLLLSKAELIKPQISC